VSMRYLFIHYRPGMTTANKLKKKKSLLLWSLNLYGEAHNAKLSLYPWEIIWLNIVLD
jgi:hypothetical protein